MYVRKEAVLSSQIEGTQSTLDDLLRYESGQTRASMADDIAEVSRCIAELNRGLEMLKNEFPISLRFIREIHKSFMGNSSAINNLSKTVP